MEMFNIGATSIIIRFKCSGCGQEIEYMIDDFPSPNMLAEDVRNSENSEEYAITCPQCEKEFNIYVYVNLYEGNVEVKDEDGNDLDFVLEEE